MTEEKDVKDQAAGLTREVLEEIAEDSASEDQQEEAQAQRKMERRAARRRRERTALLVLIPVLVVWTVLNMIGRGPFQDAVPEFDPVQTEQWLNEDLEVLVAEIEAYREKNGSLPPDLTLLGEEQDDESLTYTVFENGRYQVTLTYQGQSVSHDSAADENAAQPEGPGSE